MKIKVVEFTIEHYDEAGALWQHCEGIGLSSADSREAIKSYLERNRGMSFVALADDRLGWTAREDILVNSKGVTGS